jgi:sigma-B regulation protein RsbU (phosphoserine phosphatase)
MPARLRTIYAWLGRVGVAFFVLLAGYIAIDRLAPHSAAILAVEIGLGVTGVWLAIRLLRLAAHHATWRLRNRLLVTYLFIAVVPILLIAGLAIGGGLLLSWQLAVYLETSELDRRVDYLQSATDSVLRTPPEAQMALIERMVELFYRQRYPGIEVLVRDGDKKRRYPDETPLDDPKPGWHSTRGLLRHNRRFYLWSYEKTPTGDITITVPLTPEFLAALVPDLGVIDFINADTRERFGTGAAKGAHLPDPANQFDGEHQWSGLIPAADWDNPGKKAEGVLSVRSRVSALMKAIFNRNTDTVQSVLQLSLIIGVVVFFVVEIVSFIIGISMTRTITGAVHRLYEGTQKVIEGDFAHRIEVKGVDQLADLSKSFNSMTENLERLLVVAKEKERLQSEIEIAREVQSQLYPRVAPRTRRLNVTAICQPARMVSGDYYDYELIRDTQIALAIGDVAGKGISAALLMATLQSSLRTQLQSWLEVAATAAGNGTVMPPVSTSQLVGRLNNQLHSYTSPEKYATFLLGVYDEPSGSFAYTNAGHLPPILVSDGVGTRLDVNGTVVGAFPFSNYGESRVNMSSGDLLVCFTDGVTEPENEYGEMFGEDRLMDLVVRNAHRGDQEIIDLVIASVQQWTASEELQDDMTMLLARRL